MTLVKKRFYNDSQKHRASRSWFKKAGAVICLSVSFISASVQAASLGTPTLRSRFDAAIERAAEENHIDPNLIRAVISVESGFNRQARSHAGAVGLMQLLPSTAHRFGAHNPWKPEENITAGSRYLRYLLSMFKGNTHLAMAAYNAGEGAVIHSGYHVLARGYVAKVMTSWSAFNSMY